MKYLKIFHKQFLPLYIFLIAGCATGINGGISAEIVNVEEPVTVFTKPVEEKIQNIQSVPDISNSEIDTPNPDIEWTDPEFETRSPLLFLPRVPVEEIITNKYLITESLYVSKYFDNYDLGWDKVFYFEPVSKKEKSLEIESELNIETVLAEAKKQEVSGNEIIVEAEEIPKTIITERNITGSVLEKIDILLKGRGWIYLPDQENLDIEYIGRKFVDENTIYTFLPEIESDFTLRFQFQDFSDNIIILEKIHLNIIKELPSQVTGILDLPAEKEDIKIEENKDFKSTINSLLEKGDSESLSKLVPEILISEEISIYEILPEIAELLYESSHFKSASIILEKLILDDYFLSSYDFYLYLLGKIYEQDSPIRNEKISVKYYKLLIDRYPASIYWDESQDRYRYLKRRYIDIR